MEDLIQLFICKWYVTTERKGVSRLIVTYLFALDIFEEDVD